MIYQQRKIMMNKEAHDKKFNEIQETLENIEALKKARAAIVEVYTEMLKRNADQRAIYDSRLIQLVTP